MTGRGMGDCAGHATAGLEGPPRRGYRGGGGGRRWRHRFWTTGLRRWWHGAKDAFSPPPEQEVDALKSQAQSLSDALENLQKRIRELESESE
jgi:hypothetical protein